MAAKKKRPDHPSPRKRLETAFPKLRRRKYKITSPRSSAYNCIAWAAEEDHRWWEPSRPMDAGYYWPAGVPHDYKVSSLAEAFKKLGYIPCDSPQPEPGFEKIVIYQNGPNYSHAARQLPNGRWTSKLGSWEDIEHPLDALTGDSETTYGEIAQILKRPIRTRVKIS